MKKLIILFVSFLLVASGCSQHHVVKEPRTNPDGSYNSRNKIYIPPDPNVNVLGAIAGVLLGLAVIASLSDKKCDPKSFPNCD